MKAVIRKGVHRGKPMEAALISDAFSVAVTFPGGACKFPINIEDVYFNSDGAKEVMASPHMVAINRLYEAAFVESGYGDYVFAFKKKKKTFSYAR